jgi:two-component system, chemotaxis family, sensor histidine kinase and response regulator PixL
MLSNSEQSKSERSNPERSNPERSNPERSNPECSSADRMTTSSGSSAEDLSLDSYLAFAQRAPELLKELETACLRLRFPPADWDHLQRIVHSLKAHCAMANLEELTVIIHELETILQPFQTLGYSVDEFLEAQLLEVAECLRRSIMQHIEQGACDIAVAQERSASLFDQIVRNLKQDLPIQMVVDQALAGEALQPHLETVDVVELIFRTEVVAALERLEGALAHIEPEQIVQDLIQQAKCCLEIAQRAEVSGFGAIAEAILTAVAIAPEQAQTIGALGFINLHQAYIAVMEGDRLCKDIVSPELLAYCQGENSALIEEVPLAEGLSPAETRSRPLPPGQMEQLSRNPQAAGQENTSNNTFEGLDTLISSFLDSSPEGGVDEFGATKIQQTIVSRVNVLEAKVPEAKALDAKALDSHGQAVEDSDAHSARLNPLNGQSRHPTQPDVEPLSFDEMMENLGDSDALPDSLLRSFTDSEVDYSVRSALDYSSATASTKRALAITEREYPTEEGHADLLVDQGNFSNSENLEFEFDFEELEESLGDSSAVSSTEFDQFLSVDPLAPTPLDPWENQPAGSEPSARHFSEALGPALASSAPLQPIQLVRAWKEMQANRYGILGTQRSSPPAPKPSKPTSRESISLSQNSQSSISRLASYISLAKTIRVDVTRLDLMNNLVMELVTDEHQSLSQNRQVQSLVRTMQTRIGKVEQICQIIDEWGDRSQNSRARLHFIKRAKPGSNGALAAPLAKSPQQRRWSDTLEDLDPLLLDAYGPLYSIAQSLKEEMAQLSEAMRDMSALARDSQATQHRKYQALKQVRGHLLRSRMVPLGDLLDRFPRMVRDLCNKHGKQVNVKLSGSTTLVDRAILEKLYDPLIHMVRNAFDHGVESPEARHLQGKPTRATLEIRAYHRGNQTYIEIQDDGRGIDLDLLKAKAIDQGLVSAAEAETMSPDRFYRFLFFPGFSTQDQATELSGRGLGLDAVQSQLKQLKGSIKVSSELGQGTTFVLRLPLTLSISNLLIFSINSHTMAVPSDTVASIVLVNPDVFESQQGQLFYHWNEQYIPIYPQEALFQHYPMLRPSKFSSAIPLPQATDQLPLLLLMSETGLLGLQVDQILQEQELVIKPFGNAVAPPSHLYGCTVLGDGTLVPVLEVQAMVERQRMVDISRQVTPYIGTLLPVESPPESPPPQMPVAPLILVVDDSLTARHLLSQTLENAGYRTVMARDGKEALQQLLAHSEIQVVFCDVEMPRMNGFEFLSICRQTYSIEALPVIMLTSRDGDKHRSLAKHLGASDYLTKPYLEQDLLLVLNQYLGAQELLQEL